MGGNDWIGKGRCDAVSGCRYYGGPGFPCPESPCEMPYSDGLVVFTEEEIVRVERLDKLPDDYFATPGFVPEVVQAIRDDNPSFGPTFCSHLARLAINALRSLPVERRMEVMGMEVCEPFTDDDPLGVGSCGEHFDGKHWVER